MPRRRRAFVLPRLHRRLVSARPGFYREAGTRLGFYEAGGAPQIIDPLWNAVRLPEAVVRHEDMHQQLMINTHHGVLTQLLTQLVKEGQGQEALEICRDEQWSVQEIAATFAELMFVQRESPKDFEDEVVGAHLRAVARALSIHPSVVLADEPTANLDTENGRQVMEIMQRLNKDTGTTFVFATHDPRVIKFARRVVTLRDGLIAEDNGKTPKA